jgi:hypothetical protein
LIRSLSHKAKHNKTTRNLTNESISLLASHRRMNHDAKRDEIESVLILNDALWKPWAGLHEHRIPRSLLPSVVKQRCSNERSFEARTRVHKSARQASTPVERREIDVEIKDDTRRANSLRAFDLV